MRMRDAIRPSLGGRGSVRSVLNIDASRQGVAVLRASVRTLVRAPRTAARGAAGAVAADLAAAIRTARTPEVPPLEFTAGHVRLRPWRDEDVADVWSAMQDPAMRHWSVHRVASRRDVVAMLRRQRDRRAGGQVTWAVVDGGSGELLGSVSLHSIDRVHATAEIGCWAVPAARGRGVTTLAVEAVCRWGFAALPIDRIAFYHSVENAASGRVAEKAGFTCEGRLRRSRRYGDGRKHDELLWGRLADDPAPVDIGVR
jgi:RimJ/RimL family protein N-acetyltransferase